MRADTGRRAQARARALSPRGVCAHGSAPEPYEATKFLCRQLVRALNLRALNFGIYAREGDAKRVVSNASAVLLVAHIVDYAPRTRETSRSRERIMMASVRRSSGWRVH